MSLRLQTYLHRSHNNTDENSDILPVHGPSMAFNFIPLLDIRSDVARVTNSVSHIDQLERGMNNPSQAPDLRNDFQFSRQPTFQSIRINFSSIWNRIPLSSESFRSTVVGIIVGALTTWGFSAATLGVTNRAYEGDLWARHFEYYQYCKNLDEGQMTPECKEQLKTPFLPPQYRLKTREVYPEIKTKCPLCESECYNDSHHAFSHAAEHRFKAEGTGRSALETITLVVILCILLVVLCRWRALRRGFARCYPYGGSLVGPDDAYSYTNQEAAETNGDSPSPWDLFTATDTESPPRPKRQRRLTSCKSSSALAPLSTPTTRHVRGRRTAAPSERLNHDLYTTIRCGKATEASIASLIEQGADVNCQRPGDYCTPLQAAASTGNLQVVECLLYHGADVNASGGIYGCALQGAAQEDSHHIVQLLLERGADPNASGGKYGSALQAAAREGNEKSVMLLLQWDADVNAQGGPCGTALQAAAMRDRKTVVRKLLEAGAYVDIRGGPCGSALGAARTYGHDRIAEILISHGTRAVDQSEKGKI